jgi:serine protease Do
MSPTFKAAAIPALVSTKAALGFTSAQECLARRSFTRKSLRTGSALVLIVVGAVALSIFGDALPFASARFGRFLPQGEWFRVGADKGQASYGIRWAGYRLGANAGGEFEAKDRLADLVVSVKPAVVSVTAKYLDGSDADGSSAVGLGLDGIDPTGKPRRLVRSHGTGFFVSADGYVVTNHHVVETSRTAEVVTDEGTTYRAKVTASDRRSDLALLKIDGHNDFPFATFAERPARIGQRVFAIGSPFGFDGTVTAGIVSALQRHVEIDSDDDFIQIDAPINRGNSGGPTFDLDGNVVAVNTAIFSPSGGSVGVGFGIPAQKVRRLIAQLKAAHAVNRGWLGVRAQAVTPAIAEALGLREAHGALVDDVSGPAADAGIVSGDVISSIDAVRINDNFELSRRLEPLAPGITVHLGVVHDGSETTSAVVLGETPQLPSETATPIEWPTSFGGAIDLGLTLAPTDPSHGGDKVARTGVVVLAVRPDGRGADLGIVPGDIILDVNGRAVQTPNEIPEALHDAYGTGRSATLVRLRSGGMMRFVAVPFDPA